MDTHDSMSGSAPVLTIQCNWDDLLKLHDAEIWISCKFRGENSFDGKVSIVGGRGSVNSPEGFEVISLPDARSMKVCHLKSNCTTVFVAPGSQFSGIHKKSVVSLHTAPGGLAVSVCSENQLHIWDTKTGLIRRTLQGHVGDVYQCRFFPSGVVVLSGGADMQLKIWSAETGQCPVTLTGHTAPVMDVAVVERGRNIISVSKDGTARLWDCGQASCLGVVAELSSIINCCVVMAVSNKVALGEPDEAPSDREVGTENKVLIVGCEDGIVGLFDIRCRKMLSRKAFPSAINCIATVDEETFAVGCQDGLILLLNCVNLENPSNSWFESNSPVLSMLCHAGGLFIGRADGTCTFIPFMESRELPKRLQLTGPEYDPIYDISSDGSMVYTACRDGVIRKYDVNKPMQHLFH